MIIRLGIVVGVCTLAAGLWVTSRPEESTTTEPARGTFTNGAPAPSVVDAPSVMEGFDETEDEEAEALERAVSDGPLEEVLQRTLDVRLGELGEALEEAEAAGEEALAESIRARIANLERTPDADELIQMLDGHQIE